MDHGAVRGGEPPALGVDRELLGPAHARFAHPAGHHRRVAGLAAAAGQDALRGDHAVQVVRVGLPAHQDDLLPRPVPLHRGVGVEHRLAHRRTRGRGDPAAEERVLRSARFHCGVELREHQLHELRPRHPPQRLVEVDQALVDELGGDPERRGGGALPDPGLQHPQLAALDGELDVAQVPVVALEQGHDLEQLVVGALVDPLQIGQRHGVADPGHHVLALGVLQVVPVDALRPGRRIAGEAHAGTRVRAGVAEDHRDHVDRRAQVVRDALLAPVEHRPIGVPRREDRMDRLAKLLARVLRELRARLLLDDRLVRRHELLEIPGVEVEVACDPLAFLELVERLVEPLTADVLHRLAEHLDQAAVGVPREARVVRLAGQAVHAGVGQPHVEDGLHHPRHRELRPRAHRDQQRVVRVAELLAPGRLQRLEVLGDLRLEPLGHRTRIQVGPTRLRRDREPGRHRQPQLHHLRQVRALAPEKVLLVLVALGEVEDEVCGTGRIGHDQHLCFRRSGTRS